MGREILNLIFNNNLSAEEADIYKNLSRRSLGEGG